MAEGSPKPSKPMDHLASPPDHYWPKMYGYGHADLILTLKAVVDTH